MTCPHPGADALVYSVNGEAAMPTALVDDSKNSDWVEGFPPARPALLTRPETLWTIFGLALLAAFLSFVGFAR
jgi:hypothetical protein